MLCHLKTRRILLNILIVLIFTLIFILFFNSNVSYDILYKTQQLPNTDYDWDAEIQNVIQNETESHQKVMTGVLQKLRRHVKQDIDQMKPQIGLVDGQAFSKILVISNWRSGSSFISSIIGTYPATLLHPEVLKVITGMSKISVNEKKANASIEFLKHLFNCDFSFIQKDNSSNVWRGVQYFATNNPIWMDICGGVSNWKTNRFCSSPKLLEAICHLYPIHVFKVDRLYLDVVRGLLEDPVFSPYLKIVYLVRDPRAIHASRQQVGWCKKSPLCSQPEVLCQGLVDDFKTAVDLQAQYPHRVQVIRYEDIVSNIQPSIGTFLSSLGLPVQPGVKEFIFKNTSPDQIRGNRQGLFGRNPIETMNRWKYITLYSEVIKVQQVCHEALNVWQYREVNVTQDLPEFEFVKEFTAFSNTK